MKSEADGLANIQPNRRHGPLGRILCAGIAQSVKRMTEKPGAMLTTRVRVSGAERDFLPESNFSADSLTVSVEPSCDCCALQVTRTSSDGH